MGTDEVHILLENGQICQGRLHGLDLASETEVSQDPITEDLARSCQSDGFPKTEWKAERTSYRR